jgi:transcriptional regulator with PAS, ATPase and Fis domain
VGTDGSQIGRDAIAPPSRLLGRELELRRLAVLVDGIEESDGALLVRGEAGTGKSARKPKRS